MTVARLIVFASITTRLLGQQSTLPDSLAKADRVPVGRVETEMRHVYFHAAGAILQIGALRGTLCPAKSTAPPWFEDRDSFTISVDTADVSIDPVSLSKLMNNHVFRYPGAPLTKLVATLESSEL